MHFTLRRLVGAVCCVLAAALAAPTVAQAETQTARDPRGDVETITLDLRTAAPRVVDIVRSTNRYQGDRLRLSLELANLPETDYQLRWLVRAGGVLHVGFYFTTEEGSQFGFYPVGPVRRRGIQCEDPAVSVDRDADRVTMRVPADCFGSTEKVRVAAEAARRIGDSARARADDARRDGYDEEKGLKYGPALARS